MITTKVLAAIETNSDIVSLLNRRTPKSDWTSFTRTIFNLIAKLINQSVTKRVIENPYLLSENLLFGEQKFEMLLSEVGIKDPTELLDYIKEKEANKPFNWISGKTLQSYWSGGTPKELKINVLLAYLNIPIKEWDSWKHIEIQANQSTSNTKESGIGSSDHFNFNTRPAVKSHFLECISSYYLGSYFLYYQKCDNLGKIVKAPFVIYEDEQGLIYYKTINEGQRYCSYPAKKMANSLCFMGKNMDWEEINEMHLINIGMETNPEVLFGVSITMSKYGALPMALKNILIHQSSDIHFLDQVKETEFYINKSTENEQDSLTLEYFKKNESILFAEFGCSIEDFKEALVKTKS